LSASTDVDPLEAYAPGGFAIVMATGIVAIAARLLGHDAIGWALFATTAALYLLAWIAMVVRTLREPCRVLAAFTDHASGPGFLTAVAATSVLGSACAVHGIAITLLPSLLLLATALWLALLYGFLSAAALSRQKPTIRDGLNGGWLLLVVATESLAVLGSYVVPLVASPGPLIFACLGAFLFGCAIYAALIALIVGRFAFLPLDAHDIGGAEWINMGAMAIATLAGSRLMQLPTYDAHVAVLRQIAGPVTLLCWIVATAWIPLLTVLFAWKHLVWRAPLRYGPGAWSAVFPLGMYTSATETFSRAAELPFLRPVPLTFFWAALLAWVLAASGLARHVAGSPPGRRC
jgi:tellurite resistance protein TehA-like permease